MSQLGFRVEGRHKSGGVPVAGVDNAEGRVFRGHEGARVARKHEVAPARDRRRVTGSVRLTEVTGSVRFTEPPPPRTTIRP